MALCLIALWVVCLATSLGFVAAVDWDCDMECPLGKSKAPKKGYKAVAKGCGNNGEFNGMAEKIGFLHCCHDHNLCYGVCKADKEKCDAEFEECLASHCRTTHHLIDQKENCNSVAAGFNMGVTLFGCENYSKAQKEACNCVQNKDEL